MIYGVMLSRNFSSRFFQLFMAEDLISTTKWGRPEASLYTIVCRLFRVVRFLHLRYPVKKDALDTTRALLTPLPFDDSEGSGTDQSFVCLQNDSYCLLFFVILLFLCFFSFQIRATKNFTFNQKKSLRTHYIPNNLSIAFLLFNFCCYRCVYSCSC